MDKIHPAAHGCMVGRSEDYRKLYLHYKILRSALSCVPLHVHVP